MNFHSAALVGASESAPQSGRTHAGAVQEAAMSLAAFAPRAPGAPHGANRMIGLLAAGAVQVLLLAGLMFTTFSEPPPPPSEPLQVDLLPQEKVELPPAPPPLKPTLATPKIVMNAPPVVQIYEPPPMVAMPSAPAAIKTSSTPVAGGNPGAVVMDFQVRLLRHLNRHKRYPGSARAKRQQGVVYVRFTMDRRGNVLSATIETPSRFKDLDAEGLALLTRAQPLPIPPAEVPGDPLEMIVPVEFSLKN